MHDRMTANKPNCEGTNEGSNDGNKRLAPLNVVHTYGPSSRAPIKQNDVKTSNFKGSRLFSLVNTDQSSSQQSQANKFGSMITEKPRSSLWSLEAYQSPLDNRTYTYSQKPLFTSLFRNNNVLSEIRKTDLTKVKEDKKRVEVNKDSFFDMLTESRNEFILGGYMQSNYIAFNDNIDPIKMCDDVLQCIAKSDSEEDIFERPRTSTRTRKASTDIKWSEDYISNDINSRGDSPFEEKNDKNDPSYEPPPDLLTSTTNNKKRARKKNLSRDAGPNNLRRNQNIVKNTKTESEEMDRGGGTVSQFLDVTTRYKTPGGEQSKMSYLQQGSIFDTLLNEEEVEKSQCPICQQSFSMESIEAHASECNLFSEEVEGSGSPPSLFDKVAGNLQKDITLSGGVIKRVAESSQTDDDERVTKRFHYYV